MLLKNCSFYNASVFDILIIKMNGGNMDDRATEASGAVKTTSDPSIDTDAKVVNIDTEAPATTENGANTQIVSSVSQNNDEPTDKLDDPQGFSVTVAKRRSPKKKLLYAAALLLLVTAAGLTFLSVRSAQQREKDYTVVVNSKDYQQARKDSTKLRGSQDYDAAKQVWQDYIKDEAKGETADKQKYKAYLQLAALDETKGDCPAALKSYYAAEKIGKGEWRAENEAIARCSEKLGDLPTAIKYYQRTLDTFPGGEEYNSDLRYYRNKIDKLKKAEEAKQNG